MKATDAKLIYTLITISAVSFLAQAFDLVSIFAWSREEIFDWQLWRMLTGHLVHTNFWHMAMNLAALWLICFIFRQSFQLKAFVIVFFDVCFVISCVLFWSDFHQYVGLSGVLHGLFAFYSLQEIIEGRKSSWLLFIGLWLKIGYEQIYGANALTEGLIEAQVATNAHLAGAITGALYVYLIRSIKAYL